MRQIEDSITRGEQTMNRRRFAMFALLVLASTLTAHGTAGATAPLVLTGSIAGAAYKIEVPSPWNGTLLLYSHGTVFPGLPNPAADVRDPATGAWLLQHGYALAGSSFSSTGYAMQDALHDQIALLDYFVRRIGAPRRTIAWGTSLGGSITAGLVQLYPTRFTGALPMCGTLAGGIGRFNQYLDATFAFKTLLAPTAALPLVHVTNPAKTLKLAETLLTQAQRSAAGRARLALVAALMDIPGWFDPTATDPAQVDATAQEKNQFAYLQVNTLPGSLIVRADLERRAGGNVSWNTGVNYSDLLAQSTSRQEVQRLYAQAGLVLAADLATLQSAPRIAADPHAVAYLRQYISYDGRLQVPVLTLHTTGDGVVPVESEQVYANLVHAAGRSRYLRQLFVNRASHCSFTPAEQITALQTLIHRLDTGHWDNGADMQRLNNAASTLGPAPALSILPHQPPFYTTRQPFAPSFVPFHPSPFLGVLDNRSLR
jgi:dienelactone hydrolase